MSTSSESAAIDRYARAIFELGKETGELTVITLQLRKFTGLYLDSAELQAALSDPTLEDARRDAIIVEIAEAVGVTVHVLNVLRVLTHRRRIVLLPDITRHLSELVDADAGVRRATVTSAVALPEAYRQRLKAELEAATACKVVIEYREDPALIAGIVTQIGDQVLDGSVRTRLLDAERRLLAG